MSPQDEQELDQIVQRGQHIRDFNGYERFEPQPEDLPRYLELCNKQAHYLWRNRNVNP